jgi:hypothetical protein
MFKSNTTYTVSPKTRLDKIFADGLPINSFIDKGRCAIGATYNEIMNKTRCTILAVPNISILLNKKEAHPEIDIIYGDVTQEEVIEMFRTYKRGHKIMTTPEGIVKIINAAYATDRLEEVYNDWFLLLDEGHTFISEHYRKGILKPFTYFDLFKKKSIITATPYVFTDKKIQEQLHHHQIRFTKRLGMVHLINATSVVATLDYFLRHLDKFPGNLHIFYNSVTEIRNAILRAGLKDFNILCADDEKGKNMMKLGDLAKFFVSEPKTGKYKKVNFYTCKYFEGWDLYDESATVILVTDYHKPHTKIGVASKGKQAIGRLRSKPHQIIHITNHNHTKFMKPLETFRSEYLHEAQLLINQYNIYVTDCTQRGVKPKEDERLTKYADIDEHTNIATINLMKLDQQINEAANNEIYNHISYIQAAWGDAYFDVTNHNSNERVEGNTVIKRKSASKQLEEDYQKLLAYKTQQKEGMIFYLGETPEEEVKTRNPTAYKAWKYLDEAAMIQRKYNVKKVEAAIILKENTLAEVKLLKLIAQLFKVGMRYTNEYIKSKLQEVYTQLNIRGENGNIKVATANDLADNGRFEIKACKIPDDKGKPHNGQLIIRGQFSLKMVA